MSTKTIQHEVFHVLNYLLTYCNNNYDNSEDVKDLLNEVNFINSTPNNLAI